MNYTIRNTLPPVILHKVTPSLGTTGSCAMCVLRNSRECIFDEDNTLTGCTLEGDTYFTVNPQDIQLVHSLCHTIINIKKEQS